MSSTDLPSLPTLPIINRPFANKGDSRHTSGIGETSPISADSDISLELGFPESTEIDTPPKRLDFNTLGYYSTVLLCYLEQMGHIPSTHASTNKNANAIFMDKIGSTIKFSLGSGTDVAYLLRGIKNGTNTATATVGSDGIIDIKDLIGASTGGTAGSSGPYIEAEKITVPDDTDEDYSITISDSPYNVEIVDEESTIIVPKVFTKKPTPSTGEVTGFTYTIKLDKNMPGDYTIIKYYKSNPTSTAN